ncbi:MAG: DEAD/DEAH box helicase family protein [Bacillaceae bacterium]|nr:DEAD/DEAH box helicase family protein [Bacillaceae bacterium]
MADQPKLFADYARYCSGKLLLKRELPFTPKEIDDLISRQHLIEVPGITEAWVGYKCSRCGNRKSHLFGTIPRKPSLSIPSPDSPDNTTPDRSSAKKSFRKTLISNQRTVTSSIAIHEEIYCRKCIEMGRVSTFEPLYRWNGPPAHIPRIQNACQWTGELTTAQNIAANRIIKAIQHQEQLLVWAVCGAGKTEMLFPGLNEAFARGLRVCLSTPRTDVVTELYPRFKEAFPDISITALYGGSPQTDEGAQFVITTTHQLLRYHQAFDLIIIDEIDAFPYHADPMLPLATSRARKPDATSIYLTATPRRKMKWAARLNRLPAVFVPVRYHGHPLPIPQFKFVFRLRKNLQNQVLPQTIQNWISQQRLSSRQLLIFVPTIEDAHLIHTLIPGSEKVFASDPDRQKKIQKFRHNQIRTLVTTTILERGVTFPSVDVAVVDAGHDVFDEAALVQIAGRAGRSADDPDGDVIFFFQDKTSAMVHARRSIQNMNKRAQTMLHLSHE